MVEKIALITGAAHRIGRAIAECFLQNNIPVILHAYSSHKKLTEWARESCQKKLIKKIICADLSLSAGQEKLITECQKYNNLAYIIHNAAIFEPQRYNNISRCEFSRMININLAAPFFITQGLINNLSQHAYSSITMLIDSMIDSPGSNFAHYFCSKGGLNTLTRALARELGPNIRVNGVAPGAILFREFHNKSQKSFILKKIPQQRLGLPKEVADVVFYVATQADYLNGEIIKVDGGRALGK